jgi:prepilin signal peptidase PulO-like enzyme (type II secretory pathway)
VQTLEQPTLALDILFGITGLAVGSFLNVLALRSLKEESILSPASYCPKCNKSLSPAELIPLVSFFIQDGRCKHCDHPIAWYYPVVEFLTALLFVVCLHVFGFTIYGIGMIFFGCTLIAVCITDFKEKLIPHEITYPAILIGIVFSTTVRNDYLATLAGIGISYILFDFLAFYGLKIYFWLNKPELVLDQKRPSSLSETDAVAKVKSRHPFFGIKEKFAKRPASSDFAVATKKPVNYDLREKLVMTSHGQPIHEIEVMGGGDAVLSALIASWLGLPQLIYALLLGFMFGAFMGAIYLVIELYKTNMLKSALRSMIVGTVGGFAIAFFFLFNMSRIATSPIPVTTWIGLLLAAAIAGGLLGIIVSGTRASKPFPFGPALAFGAFVAMFHNPFGKLGGGGA